ncbi:integration host factor, actinobacterial type [Trueperella sp. LYQ143]|uniref:integration host factor, actinobacterial type n=1 Tax=unclassified Trueperella TaxID=2630174 RepID=UPI00398383C9
MALPTLTPEERVAALEKAAVARKKRAAIKEDLKSGKTKLSDVLKLAQDDPVIGKLKVSSLLQSMPGIGPAKCETIMKTAKISDSRRVAGLGKHQTQRLVELFG